MDLVEFPHTSDYKKKGGWGRETKKHVMMLVWEPQPLISKRTRDCLMWRVCMCVFLGGYACDLHYIVW